VKILPIQAILFLQRYLPFLLVNLIEGLWIILLPLFQIMPEVYIYVIKHDLIAWYVEITLLEDEAWENYPPEPEQFQAWMKEIEEIAARVNQLEMPQSHCNETILLSNLSASSESAYFYNMRSQELGPASHSLPSTGATRLALTFRNITRHPLTQTLQGIKSGIKICLGIDTKADLIAEIFGLTMNFAKKFGFFRKIEGFPDTDEECGAQTKKDRNLGIFQKSGSSGAYAKQ
jgi:hypothetical protein